MHTEAADAGDTGTVLAGDGTTSAMQVDPAVTTKATTTATGVQAEAASPISAAVHDTMSPEQPDHPHLELVAAATAAPVRGINPVQVGIDVTLSPCMPGGLPPPHDRLSLSCSWNSLCVLPTLRAACQLLLCAARSCLRHRWTRQTSKKMILTARPTVRTTRLSGSGTNPKVTCIVRKTQKRSTNTNA